MHYLRIPDYIYDQFKKIAKFRGITIRQVTEEALFWYLNLMSHKIGLLDYNSDLLEDFYSAYADILAEKVVEKIAKKLQRCPEIQAEGNANKQSSPESMESD
jgi:hypothetical protein